jgi:predicted MFS family arabinose efflux permease
MSLRSEITRRSLLVLVACTACQMGAGLFYATQALSADVINELGWTRAQWSSALVPMLFVSSIAQAFVGAACVRFGVRPVITCAVLLLGAASTVLANVHSLWQLHVAMLLVALANAGIGDVSVGAVVTRWFDRARGIALGFATVGSNLGAVIFVQALAGLSAEGSWREASLQVGLGGVAVILPFALFVIRDPGPGEGPAPDEPIAPTLEPSSSLREILRKPAFWIFFLTVFGYALAQLGIINHLRLHLEDLGYSTREAQDTLSLAIGAGIAAKLGAGVIALSLTPRVALAANTLLLAGSFALIPYADDARVLGLFGVVFGVAVAARDVLVPLLLARIFGTRDFAKIFGLVMLAYAPGGALGPLALGALHDTVGSYAGGFALVGGILLLAAIGQLRLRESPAA